MTTLAIVKIFSHKCGYRVNTTQNAGPILPTHLCSPTLLSCVGVGMAEQHGDEFTSLIVNVDVAFQFWEAVKTDSLRKKKPAASEK
jgi:hypothetical protein